MLFRSIMLRMVRSETCRISAASFVVRSWDMLGIYGKLGKLSRFLLAGNLSDKERGRACGALRHAYALAFAWVLG